MPNHLLESSDLRNQNPGLHGKELLMLLQLLEYVLKWRWQVKAVGSLPLLQSLYVCRMKGLLVAVSNHYLKLFKNICSK